MAQPRTQDRLSTGVASPEGMSSIQKLSIAALVIGLFNRAGFGNALASTAVAFAAPAAATAFVYEVSTLRSAQLEHEAQDRGDLLHRAPQATPAPANGDKAGPIEPPAPPDIGGKLDGMIASRTRMLDLFGDDPSTVAPIYARIIRQMLHEDDTALASLRERAETGAGASLAAKEAMLRVIHNRLMRLAGT